MDKVIAAMRQQGATDADIEAYIRSQGGIEVGRYTPDDLTSNLGDNKTNVVSDMAAQILAAPAKMVTTYGEGAARLGSRAYKAVTGDKTLNRLDRAANSLRTTREDINELMAPESGLATGVGVAADLVANALPYIASGGAFGALRGALVSAGLTGVQSQAGRDASLTSTIADMTNNDALKRVAASGWQRTLADMGMDAGLSVAGAGAARLMKARAAAKAATEDARLVPEVVEATGAPASPVPSAGGAAPAPVLIDPYPPTPRPVSGRVKTVSARARGTAVPDVPLIDEARPRMFKEKDFELSVEGRKQFIDILGPTGTQQKVTWAQANELAEVLSTDPQTLLRHVGDLSGEEVLALKKVTAQDIERIGVLSKIAYDPATTLDGQRAALDEIARRSADLSTYAARVTRETSQTARDLNLAKVMAKNTMDPATWLVHATRTKGLPLTATEVEQITRMAAARDREGLYLAVASLRTMEPIDKLITTWKAGLLTNPKSQLVNIAGNLGMAVLEQAKDAPAAVVDMVASLATGTRTKAVPGFESARAAIRNAWEVGLPAARQIMRTGASAEDMAKWDFRNGRFGKTLGSDKVGAILDFYTQTVFRSLGAVDAIFKAAAVGRSLDEQIVVESMNIAKRTAGSRAPISAADAALSLRKDVPAAMQAQAIADAEYATFQSPNLIAGAVNTGKNYLAAQGRAGNLARVGVELNLPFVKTPSNIIDRVLDYTPAGVLRAVAPAWRMAKGQDMIASQKKIAEAFGRAGTGSLLLWLGWEMGHNDTATGTLPLGARDEWKVRGRLPGAVRTSPKGDWHEVVRLQPWGTLVTLGAQLRAVVDNAQSASDVAGGAAASVGKIIINQPFLQGLNNIQDAINDPEKSGGAWLRSTAASAIPAIVSAAAREIDPVDRDPKTMAQALAARTPLLSQTVPPKLDVFGREQSHVSFPGAQFVDLTQTTSDKETAALREARRLNLVIGKPSRSLTVSNKNYTLAPDEYQALLQKTGPETERLLNAAILRPGYLKERSSPERTDQVRAEILRDAIAQSRARYELELARTIRRAIKQGSTDYPATLTPPKRKL